MTIIETIKARKSCRTYSNKPIEAEKLAELRQFLASNKETPFGSRVRFFLLDFNKPPCPARAQRRMKMATT
jgi:hypothetical protein